MKDRLTVSPIAFPIGQIDVCNLLPFLVNFFSPEYQRLRVLQGIPDSIQSSVLYLLAAPSTPAREEVVEMAEAGETITHKQTQELIEAHGNTGP